MTAPGIGMVGVCRHCSLGPSLTERKQTAHGVAGIWVRIYRGNCPGRKSHTGFR